MRWAAGIGVGICGVLACGPGNPGGSSFANEDDAWSQWSAEVCQLQSSCDCADAVGPEECRDAFDAAVEELRGFADELDLTFDGACFELAVDRTHDLGCATIDELAAMASTNAGFCKVYYGTKQKGQACETVYAFDECAQGLFCLEDVCVDWSGTAQEGEPCYDEDAPGPCASGLVCRISVDGSGESTSMCIRPARVGEPCVDTGCADGLLCDAAQDACVEPPSVGEPCPAGRCDEESRCDLDTDPENPMCVDRLADGSACESDDDCVSDECGDESTCEPEQAWICELSFALGEMPQG